MQKERKTIYLDKNIAKKLELKSVLEDKTQSQIVNDILEKELKQISLAKKTNE